MKRLLLISSCLVAAAVTLRAIIGLPYLNTNPIADTFTDANGTSLSSHVTTTGGFAWVQIAAQMSITNNTCYSPSGSDGAIGYYVTNVMGSADYTATIDVSSVSPGGNDEASLGIRYNGLSGASRSGYFVTWLPDIPEARLYRVVSGTVSSSLGALTVTTCTNMSITASGSTISAKANGTLIVSVTDTNITAAGVVAIGPFWRAGRNMAAIRFDNLNVTLP